MNFDHQLEALPEGYVAPKKPVLIVGASFYPDFLGFLKEGACAVLERHGCIGETVLVPGALEIPSAILQAHHCGKFSGYVALGVVIRGETTHYDLVTHMSALGIQTLSLKGLCIGNGIIVAENKAQAWERCLPHKQDKGGWAAYACLSLIHIQNVYGQ